MENITIIIPINEYSEDLKNFLDLAIDSINNQKNKPSNVLAVGPSEVLKNYDLDSNIEKVFNENDTDYCSQINKAVDSVKTKYFSILAIDDQYNEKWFSNVEKYISYMPEYSVYAPIVNLIDKEGDIVGTINELGWAMSFVEGNNLGEINEKCLQAYYDFSVNGAVFRTDDFIEVGKLKPSIKLAFWYEYLLRATNQGMKIYVIPKNGYYHYIDRKGSMMDNFSKEMDGSERAWWIKLATKEYYFKQERKKSYKYVSDKKLEEIEGLK